MNYSSNSSINYSLISSFIYFASMCCVKTWCKAWTTSARMYDTAPTQFLFGCSHTKYHLQHYLRCERLGKFLFQFLKIPPYAHLPERLVLAVAFVTYHKGRAQARNEGRQMILNAAWM